jgi:hypothetical protein
MNGAVLQLPLYAFMAWIGKFYFLYFFSGKFNSFINSSQVILLLNVLLQKLIRLHKKFYIK